MNIITSGVPNDDEVLVNQVTIKYVQNPDCTEDRDRDWQELIVSTRDNGVAKFLNIKTENWSIDNADSLKDVIEDFCRRINYYEQERV